MNSRRSQKISNSSAALVIIFFLLILVGLSNIFIFHNFLVVEAPSSKSNSNGRLDFNQQIDASKQYKPIDASPLPDQEVKQPPPVLVTSTHKVMAEGEHHAIAGLSCKDHGGPDDEIASEMVFWSDIPSDSDYKSPFYDPEKYITFEPDGGGWNNIRMAYETILVMAHAMGRTLVLPPDNRMYLLGKGGEDHKKEFSFNDFFHLDSIAMEHKGFNIITMEEFLKRKGLTDQLKDTETGQVMRPPGDKTNWNGEDSGLLRDYLRSVGKYPEGWNPSDCIAAIPSSKDPKAVDELQSMFDDIIAGKYGGMPEPTVDFVDAPAAVDGETVHRFREMMAGRNKICIYDKALQEQQLLHFKVDHSEKARMLTHFYAFVFFQDWVS